MFHIKICGVRKIADIQAVSLAGAGAIGLNFYPPSCRFVDPEKASTAELADKAGELGVFRVGVFVNEPADRIVQITNAVSLDAVQLHGDELPEIVERLQQLGISSLIRAIKLPVGPLSVAEIESRTMPWSDLGTHLLLDADGGQAHGGTGKTLDWTGVQQWATKYPQVGWTLAGGLGPENVAAAIAASGAQSVDTASGVEATRGSKSGSLIRQFVAACDPLLC